MSDPWEFINLMKNKKALNIAGTLEDMLRTRTVPIETIGDIIGDLLKKDSEFFMDNVNPLLQIMLKKSSKRLFS